MEGGGIRCLSCIKYNKDCIFKEKRKRGPDSDRLIYLKHQKAVLEQLLADKEREKAKSKEQMMLIPTTSLISSDVLRRQTLGKWTQLDFFLIFIADLDGTKFSFVDFYFKYVFRWLPILSKTFVTSNLLEYSIMSNP